MSIRYTNTPTSLSGRVLVAGCGFVVTGAAWALFGFVEQLDAFTMIAAIYFALSILHVAAGAATLGRQRLAWQIALPIALVGLVFSAVEMQIVLVSTNVVILALLWLARADIATRSSQK
jgi:hypothetical protein